MKQPDQNQKNVKKCPKCGDTMGINAKGKPVCICQLEHGK
jgi:hypothetical protein